MAGRPGRAAQVAVDGRHAYARTVDVDEMADARHDDEVPLLPAFDQWVPGPGTRDTTAVPALRLEPERDRRRAHLGRAGDA